MLSIRVKFTSGVSKFFDNIDSKFISIGENFLTVGTNQKVDEDGKWLSGCATRMPLVNIMYFETVDTGEDITVESKGA